MNFDRDELIETDEQAKLDDFTNWALKERELEKKEACIRRSQDLNRGIR